MISPIHALYERPSISVALFISDHLHMNGMATVRFAWLLARRPHDRGGVLCDLPCPDFASGDPQIGRLR